MIPAIIADVSTNYCRKIKLPQYPLIGDRVLINSKCNQRQIEASIETRVWLKGCEGILLRCSIFPILDKVMAEDFGFELDGEL